MTASTASAQNFDIVPEDHSAKITGSDHNGGLDWHFGVTAIECAETEVGTGGETEPYELFLEPTFKECKGKLFNITVDPNGCKLQFAPGMIENGKYEGSVSIGCDAGKQIVVTTSGCKYTVPPQQGLTEITYTNTGTGKGRELTVDFNIVGLAYQEDKFGFFPTCKDSGVKFDAAVTGYRTLTAEVGTNRVGLSVEPV
jgi:hypothetical protein